MKNTNNHSFLENKERLAEIIQLGRQLEHETVPERKENLRKEIAEKGEILKASLGFTDPAADEQGSTVPPTEVPQGET